MGLTADKAVSRWFTPDSRNGAEWTRVRGMIAEGSADGMEKVACAAVQSVGHNGSCYDGKRALGDLGVPALFVCGSGDGMLPEEMETYSAMMRDGMGKSVVIGRATRLVFCEQPEAFVDIVQEWLEGGGGLTGRR